VLKKLAAGFVRHMEVVFVNAPQMLRLAGASGRCRAWGERHAELVLKPDAAGTRVLAEYSVAGYLEGGFAESPRGRPSARRAARALCRALSGTSAEDLLAAV